MKRRVSEWWTSRAGVGFTETGESLEGMPRVTWLCVQGLHSPAHHRRLGLVYHMTQSHLHARLDSQESGFLGLRLGWGRGRAPGGRRAALSA